jgi:RHS repeat-associated protein
VAVTPAGATATNWVTTPTSAAVGIRQFLQVEITLLAGGFLPCDATQSCNSSSFGFVRFLDGSTVLGESPVQGTTVSIGGLASTAYRASLNWVPTTASSHTITARYLGTIPNAPSSVSASVSINSAGATTTTWVTQPAAMTVGTNQALVVQVAPAAGGHLPCDDTQGCGANGFGTVRFLDRSKVLAEVAVQPTVIGSTLDRTADTVYRASLNWTPTAFGARTITAQYLGTAPNAPSAATAAINVWSRENMIVSLTAPAVDSVAQPGTTLTLAADAISNGGMISRVDFMDNGTLLGTSTSIPYSFAWNNGPIGTHQVTARSIDSTGAATVSPAVSIRFDAQPAISLTAPIANSVFHAPTGITLAATAGDIDGTIAKVEFLSDGALVGTSTSAPYAFVWSGAPAGSHQLTARATDNDGGATTSTAVTIVVNVPPSVALTSPSNGTAFDAPGNIQLTASSSDSDGSVVQVNYFANDALVGSTSAAPWTFEWSNVRAGRYRIAAQAIDNVGGTITSAAVTVTVGAAPPDTAYYIEVDHLNTPRMIANQAGTTVWRWDNTEAFGNSIPNDDPDGDGTAFVFDLRFPGQFFDRETGLAQNWFRDYDSSIGRYVQSDPIGLQSGINTYSYVRGYPLGLADSSGLLYPELEKLFKDTAGQLRDLLMGTPAGPITGMAIGQRICEGGFGIIRDPDGMCRAECLFKIPVDPQTGTSNMGSGASKFLEDCVAGCIKEIKRCKRYPSGKVCDPYS